MTQPRRYQRVYDEQGVLYAKFQRLPGEENKPLYLAQQSQINQSFPDSFLDFGLTRLPVAGELLKVNQFLWRVEQVIHHPANAPVDPDDLFPEMPSTVGTVQISFYGVIAETGR